MTAIGQGNAGEKDGGGWRMSAHCPGGAKIKTKTKKREKEWGNGKKPRREI